VSTFSGGQYTIAALWYFKNIRRFNLNDSSSALYGLLDNNDLFKTPDFWKDDSLLYRFASSVHKDNDNKISSGTLNIFNIDVDCEYDPILDYEAKYHWNAFYASMILTNRPQLLGISKEKEGEEIVGHAMIAYKIEGNKLYVADPNYPGEIRYIEYENEKFKPYSSGANAQEIKTIGETGYNRIYFLGEFATIDEWKVEKRWNEVVNKDLNNEYFPYPMILSDGLETYKKNYEFNIEVSPSELQSKIKFYLYDKNLNKIPTYLKLSGITPNSPLPFIPVNDMKEKYVVSLNNEGDNWIGFHYVTLDPITNRENWVGF